MEQRRHRANTAVGAALLLLIATALFAPALFQDKLLAPLDIRDELMPPWGESDRAGSVKNDFVADAVTQYLPYRLIAAQSLDVDGYIGWNPYEMGGYNLAANTMALPGTWTMQLHRWLDFCNAWNFGLLAEFLIAGIGMLVFLRDRKLPWIPCMIGATAFMLNAQFIMWVYHRWALGSFCWMPWLLWSYGQGITAREWKPKIILLPLFMALALLGGTLQHAVFVFLACGCLALGSLDLKSVSSIKRQTFFWSACGLGALLVSAFTLVPQILAYFHNIEIGHTRGGIGYPHGLTQPFLNALIIPARIWPWLIGDQATLDGWKLLKSNYMSLNYIGTVPMILGFLGLLVPSLPKAAKLMIGFGILIPLTPLVGPLYHRVELVFILGACWLSAEFLAKLPAWETRLPWKRILISGTIAIGMVLLAFALLPLSIDKPLEEKVTSLAVKGAGQANHAIEEADIEQKARLWKDRLSILHPRTAWVYLLLAAGVAGLVAAASHKKSTACAGGAVILAATALELGTLFQSWTTFSPKAQLRSQQESITRLNRLADGGWGRRVWQYTENLGQRDTFATPNLLAAEFIPSVNAYESIQAQSIWRKLADEKAETRADLAGVYVAIHAEKQKAPPGTVDWDSVALYPGHIARINPAPLPYIGVGSGKAPQTPESTVQSLQSSNSPVVTNGSLNRMHFTFMGEADWLRIGHNWHPGWKWRANDGNWMPFVPGPDHACWINELPPGAQDIDVQFFPRPAWTAWVSIVAACAALTAFLVLLAVHRSPSNPPQQAAD